MHNAFPVMASPSLLDRDHKLTILELACGTGYPELSLKESNCNDTHTHTHTHTHRHIHALTDTYTHLFSAFRCDDKPGATISQERALKTLHNVVVKGTTTLHRQTKILSGFSARPTPTESMTALLKRRWCQYCSSFNSCITYEKVHLVLNSSQRH